MEAGGLSGGLAPVNQHFLRRHFLTPTNGASLLPLHHSLLLPLLHLLLCLLYQPSSENEDGNYRRENAKDGEGADEAS